MTDVRIRRLEPDDWATMRDVRLAALAESPTAFGSTTAREVAFPESEWRRRIGNSPSFVAWRASEPVGLAGVINRKLLVPELADDEWELVGMWVRPDARGGGVADRLVGAVVDAVKAEQAERVTLWVADGNARAREFYIRFAFEPTGARQVFKRHDGSQFDEEQLAFPVGPDAG
jgi:GNAT superfamily N-acetyltransferase